MTLNAVDCTGLNQSQINNLKTNGVTTVGRYLSHSTWKGLTVDEVANIKAAGLQIFSIYETNPTAASYFVSGKGKSDALDAVSLAKAVGQPEGTAIYFTVDYDAQAKDFPNILNYFKEIRANLTGYKIGAYGSFAVLNYLYQNNAADYWFQTVAWSGGQHCSFLNIYQFQCDKTLGGVNVDYDNLEKSDVGAWGTPTKIIYFLTGGYAAGDALCIVLKYIQDRKWWYQPTRKDDGSLMFLVGGLGENTPEANGFENLLKTNGCWYQIQ